MKGIVPKNKTKGVDFCGQNDYTYIIRSDLGCYMRSSNINQGSDLTIFNLHPACQDGDHYFADTHGYFYIIKGNSYRKVEDLSTDSNAVVGTLPPNFQGGDFYFAAHHLIYIIFQESETYIATLDLIQMTMVTVPMKYSINSKGLYYWGQKKNFSVLKPASEWGVEYYEGSDPSKSDGRVLSVHPDVLNFLPGGLSIIRGPAFGRWESIKTITNDSNTPMTWQKKVLKRVGYNQEKMKEITHNWKIGASATLESKAIETLIVKFQLAFSAEYGGSHVDTEKETWDEATEVEEQLTFQLKPGERLYLWQYQLGLGNQPVLFCRDLKVDDEPNPPTEVPLPPAKY